MTALTAIDVTISTKRYGGTDGRIYLGICGREFRCDTDDDDFEDGSNKTYVFGAGTNVRRPDLNDPRQPALVLEDQDRFPVYLRFDQADSGLWHLNQAWVQLNDSDHQDYEARLRDEGLRLHEDTGSFCYLHKHVHPTIG